MMSAGKTIRSFLGRIRPYNGVKTPVILQLSETECGIASLAIIFSFYQFNPPFEELREKCGTSRDGSKLTTLMHVARDYGFTAKAFKMELDAIALLEEPVIAFWGFNHFVVINGVGHNKVFMNDPAHGEIAVSIDEFDKAFTGIVLAITPTPKTIKLKSKPVLKTLIDEWLTGFRLELLFLFMGLLLILSSPLLNSALNSIFIDQCVISSRVDWLPYIAAFAVASSLIFTLSSLIQKWNQFKLCTQASILKASRIISHILKLPLLFYALRQKSEIISILSRAEGAVNLFSKNAVIFSVSAVTAMICFACMVKVDNALALISLFVSMISCLSLYCISRIKLAYEKSNMNAAGKLYAASLSNIRNIETIKACGFEENALKKWQLFFIRKLKIQDKISITQVIMETLNKFYDLGATLLILMVGGFRIANGSMSVGNLMAYYSIHLFFSKTIHLIFNAFKESQSAYVTHIRISDMMHYEQDLRFHEVQNKAFSYDRDSVLSCKNLTFFYNKTVEPTLKNVTADIRPGEHIALVGGTGSGKSTLAKLICGLYQPHMGEIMLAGSSIATFEASKLAVIFAYVSQDVSLFTGTLYENLTLWKKNIPHSLIEEAIADACLTDLIEARGLYAKVFEGGDNFSGGEKQRIDIARSLIQNTPLLILDEATSSLDIQTEARLIQNLRKRCKTIVFVAHRLSTVKHCDQIWVMQNGQMIERGNHHSLMNLGSHYYRLVQADASNHHLQNKSLEMNEYEASIY